MYHRSSYLIRAEWSPTCVLVFKSQYYFKLLVSYRSAQIRYYIISKHYTYTAM